MGRGKFEPLRGETATCANLEFVRVMHDPHREAFGSAIDEREHAGDSDGPTNDYGRGAASWRRWPKSKRYTAATPLVFRGGRRNDAQGRTRITWTLRIAAIAFVAGAVREARARLVSNKYTTVSMVATIIDILGIEHPGHV